MGHIEEAIERAKRRREGAPAATVERVGKRPEPNYPIVKLAIKPSHHYRLDPRVLAANRIISAGFDERPLTAFKMLRTQILQDLKTNNWRTVGVTAPAYGGGKTVTAINLAISIARQGDHDVFLVDLDLKRPAVADHLGLPADEGVSEYLDSDAVLNDFLWDVGIDRLTVFPCVGSIDYSSELLTSKRMIEAVFALRSAGDNPVAVLNLPPVLAGDDVLAVAEHIDSMLMVASERETRRRDLDRAMELLGDPRSLCVVLTKASGG
jgi:protein-tyrosine kinase